MSDHSHDEGSTYGLQPQSHHVVGPLANGYDVEIAVSAVCWEFDTHRHLRQEVTIE